MSEVIDGAPPMFRPATVGSLNACIVDSSPFASSGWSPGAVSIFPLPIQPPLSVIWSILGWSFSFEGAMLTGNVHQAFGRLGSLWCGIIRGSANEQLATSPPLPADLSTFARAWDGGQDPPFPNMTNTATVPAVPLGVSTQLPQPIELQSGEQVSFGLWLTPMLCQEATVAIYNAGYAITLEERLAPTG